MLSECLLPADGPADYMYVAGQRSILLKSPAWPNQEPPTGHVSKSVNSAGAKARIRVELIFVFNWLGH